MTSFTVQWNSTYEGLPPNTEDAKKGAARIRDFKRDFSERFEVDHKLAGDEHDGKHAMVTLRELTADPTTESGGGVLYAKLQGTIIQLYYKDSAGNVFPLTSSGGGIANLILPGTILPFGNGSDADGVSYVQCDGRAISRVSYSGLFFAISTLWGAGDGVNTFNVPDLRGRGLVGRGAAPGGPARVAGSVIGAFNHVLTLAEMPAHTHTVAINGGAAAPGTVAAQGANVSTANVSSGSSGSGNAFDLTNPGGVINWWIKT